MNPFKPKDFIEYINQNQWTCVECGTISAPINNLTLAVDNELQMSMVLTSEKSSTCMHVVHPPGTVRRLDENLIFLSSINTKMSVHGYQRKNKQKSNVVVETYDIAGISVSLADECFTEYTLDWLDNVHDSSHSWPDAVDFDNEVITIGAGEDKLQIRIKDGDFGFGFSSSCMQLCIGGVICYFFHLDKFYKDEGNSPGFMLYKGRVDLALREKILTSLSFIIGRQLINVGYCYLDLNWNPLAFSYQSSTTEIKKALRHVSQPPLNIYSAHTFMDGDLISKLITETLNKFEVLKFDRIMWRYWFARYAPIHSGAVQIGAIIELLQGIYLELNEDTIKSTIVDKKKFKTKIKPGLTDVINSLDLSGDEKNIFIDKLNDLNRLSLKKKSELFFSYLGLNLSSLELQAWQQRNDAAHGNLYESDKSIDVVREIKVLINILHRQIIKTFKLGDSYIDYYSLNHPVRPMHQGCESDG